VNPDFYCKAFTCKRRKRTYFELPEDIAITALNTLSSLKVMNPPAAPTKSEKKKKDKKKK
jgi:hypothetical protein